MRSVAITTLALVLSACSDPPAAPELGPPTAEASAGRDPAMVARGRQIFMTGTSPSGEPIEAVLAGDVVTSARTVPCVGCHGEDGRGRPEGGMTPSNITWEQLSKPYGGRGEDGREHVAYDARSLRKAITMGLDPSGNQLLSTMPRHRMSLADIDSLVAYLETLGEHHAIGIDDQTIRLATVQPAEGTTTVEAVLLAYFAEINQRGGVFGRRLELEILRLPSTASVDEQLAALATFLADHACFAVIAPQLGSGESALLQGLANAGVPVVGPATKYPDPGTPPMHGVFHVDGGIPAQALALASFAARRSQPGQPGPRGLVVFPDREPERALGQAVIEVWQRAEIEGLSLAVALDGTRSAAELGLEVDGLAPEFVVFLGPAELGLELLGGLANTPDGAAPPELLLPGSLPLGDPFTLPDRFEGRVFAAYPWTPEDLAPAALRDYQALAEAHDLPATARPVQLASLAAAKIMLEGLTRAGRAVTRESLIDNLEGLREFTTGLTPPITYGPNRHIGLHEPRIVRFDLDTDRLTPVESTP